MVQHPFNIQAFPIVTVLPIVPALSQLLTNPSHAVPAGLCRQVRLCIPGSSCLCQLGLMLCGMTIQPAGNSRDLTTISARNCVHCMQQCQHEWVDCAHQFDVRNLLHEGYSLKSFVMEIEITMHVSSLRPSNTH